MTVGSHPPDVPNAGSGLKTLPEKEKWNRAFEKYLRTLDAKKPVIWCGDLNVVATPLGELPHFSMPSPAHYLRLTHETPLRRQTSATGRPTTTSPPAAQTRRSTHSTLN